MGKDNPDLGKVMCFPLAVKIIEKSKEKSEEVAEEGETNLAFFDIILTGSTTSDKIKQGFFLGKY